MFDKEPKDWRELLGWITSDPATSQRIVQELGVREITIKRWVEGPSKPRQQNLRRLLSAIPEYRERFIELISDGEEFEEFSDLSFDESLQEISSKFYTQIFQMRGTISQNQRYWSVANAVINQALSHLSPDGLGIAISVVRCMIIPDRDKIFSLRQSVGQATNPWPSNLEQRAMFLAAESLAGYTVSTCRPAEVLDYSEDKTALLGHQFEREMSASAHPILYAGKIAGCLLASSTEPNYFASPSRLALVADYAHLMALAFELEDFVDASRIELRVMPPHSEQRTFFDTFRQRLTEVRIKLHEEKAPHDAELLVWEGLETEIFQQQQLHYQTHFPY